MRATIGLGCSALLAACSSNVLPIVMPPPDRLPQCIDRIGTAGCDSHLVVPMMCPVFAPGDSDDDDEDHFTNQIAVSCVVDEYGHTYGTVTGDQGPGLAVIPGDRELGLYIAFRAETPPVVDNLTVSGDTPALEAFAAPDNVEQYPYPTPETNPANRIPMQIVAVGPTGILLSFGRFGTTSLQLEADLDEAQAYPDQPLQLIWNERFYINGVP